MASRRTPLQHRLATLADHQGGSVVPSDRDPWHLILLENVVYLSDPETRRQAFEVLREQTELDADVIGSCPDEVLLEACGRGRMAEKQVRKLRQCAALFEEVGDPRDLVTLPIPKARKALKRFPGIGDPGAEKLLLFAGMAPILALESNGLRTLLRLGYGEEAKSYSTSYRSAQRAAAEELPAECEVLIQAHLALFRHGREVCRNTKPECGGCVLRRSCPSG